jgi:DNA primase
MHGKTNRASAVHLFTGNLIAGSAQLRPCDITRGTRGTVTLASATCRHSSPFGLTAFDPKTNTLTHYAFPQWKPPSTGVTRVTAILEDRLGGLWMATHGAGCLNMTAITEGWIAIDYPDRMIFDLDPAPEVPFEALKLAAQDLKQRLQHKGLESVLKVHRR